MTTNEVFRALGRGAVLLLLCSCDDGMAPSQPTGCASGSECTSGICTAGACVEPSCTDKVKNGSEADVDCGGSCGPCGNGLSCTAPAGCQSGVCSSGRCVPGSCTDRVKNGAETDVDCGGACGPCADGLACTAPAGCQSGVCNASGRCATPTCTDNVKNGSEIDKDCGGSCSACGPGLACVVVGDCQAGLVCTTKVCTTPRSCLDLQKGRPQTTDGVQSIDPDGPGGAAAFKVYCDMTNDGGGWTRAVNIKGNSVFHLDQVDAVGDVSDAAVAAKLSDATINQLNTVGYFRYNCGSQVNLYVKNVQNTWTSQRTNALTWSIDRGRDGTFECAANRAGYVFSDFAACPTGHTNYAAAAGAAEGSGCYNATWNLDGNLWVK